jgi:single-stranded-DNA-specific exonuclease
VLAQLAAGVAMRAFKSDLAVDTKGDGSPVTAADRAAEQAAAKLAAILNGLNADRQTMEKNAVNEALLQAEEQMQTNPTALIVAGPWHAGVVGLVASRLKEKFYRPTFAFAHMEDGTFKGSARSIEGVDVGAAVAGLSHLTLSGGGHAMAAGATVSAAHWPAFQTALLQVLTAQLHTTSNTLSTPIEVLLTPILNIHATTTAEGLTGTLFNHLNQLAPFGPSNPEPTLAITQAIITYSKTIGTTAEHIRLKLASGQEAIAFGAARNNLAPVLTQSGGKPLTLAGKLKQSQWNGRTTTELHITDAHQNWIP